MNEFDIYRLNKFLHPSMCHCGFCKECKTRRYNRKKRY